VVTLVHQEDWAVFSGVVSFLFLENATRAGTA
jgi:hypothetical protein